MRLIYERGAFTAADTRRVAPALAAFALGLTFANVNIMFNRGFQSMQRPWFPLYVGLVNLALNALLDWVLLGPLGVTGITLSTSLVSIFNTVVLVWLIRRKWARIDGRRIAGAGAGAAAVRRRRWPSSRAGLWYALHAFARRGFLPAARLRCSSRSRPAPRLPAALPRLLHLEELAAVPGGCCGGAAAGAGRPPAERRAPQRRRRPVAPCGPRSGYHSLT